LGRGHSSAIKWGPLVKGDLHETERLVRTLQEHKIQAVIHFAAYAYVGESVEKPELYYENNFGGSLSLLKAMQKAGVTKIVFSSTCATYGIPEQGLISESSPQNPINPYGQSKLMVEKMLQDCSKAWGLQACSLRYFNAAGADPDVEIGESHEPETHLIPLAIDAGLGKIPEIAIFGNDYPTKDGTCIRDYIHVQDLAKAHIAALRKLNEGAIKYDAFNIGTGHGFSVLEVLEKTSELLGQKVPSRISARRPGDPPMLVADPSKAWKQLQWKAEISDLDTIVKTAIQWARSSKP
jgi:UDP-arabinose 4-epimerase